MKIIVVPNNDEMSAQAYQILRQTVKENPLAVLGLATGITPEGMYRLAVEDFERGDISFSGVTTFNLDEYVGLDGDDKNSYRHYMQSKFFRLTDIDGAKTFIPCAVGDIEQNCKEYDRLLDKFPRDFQLLGIGRNGHIGFCEPNTPFNVRTHCVNLTADTLSDNARLFERGRQIPKSAITMGLVDILSARKIVLVASGGAKADALSAMLQGINPRIPASFLLSHADCTLIADVQAAKCLDAHLLSRFDTQNLSVAN